MTDLDSLFDPASKHVSVPPGDYAVDATIELSADTVVEMTSDTRIHCAPGVDAFRVTGSNVKVIGNKASLFGCSQRQGTSIIIDPYSRAFVGDHSPKTKLSFENLRLWNWGFGFLFDDVDDLQISYCRAEGWRTAFAYIGIEKPCKNVHIWENWGKTTFGSYFQGVTGKGIQINGEHVKILYNYFHGGTTGTPKDPNGCRDGIFVSGGRDINIWDNTVERFGDDSITVFKLDPVGGISIRGNHCVGSCSTYGIYLFGDGDRVLRDITVSGNTCVANACAGIHVSCVETATLFQNDCYCNGCDATNFEVTPGQGILVRRSKGILVKANKAWANTRQGVFVQNVTLPSGERFSNEDISLVSNNAYWNGEDDYVVETKDES